MRKITALLTLVLVTSVTAVAVCGAEGTAATDPVYNNGSGWTDNPTVKVTGGAAEVTLSKAETIKDITFGAKTDSLTLKANGDNTQSLKITNYGLTINVDATHEAVLCSKDYDSMSTLRVSTDIEDKARLTISEDFKVIHGRTISVDVNGEKIIHMLPEPDTYGKEIYFTYPSGHKVYLSDYWGTSGKTDDNTQSFRSYARLSSDVNFWYGLNGVRLQLDGNNPSITFVGSPTATSELDNGKSTSTKRGPSIIQVCPEENALDLGWINLYANEKVTLTGKFKGVKPTDGVVPNGCVVGAALVGEGTIEAISNDKAGTHIPVKFLGVAKGGTKGLKFPSGVALGWAPDAFYMKSLDLPANATFYINLATTKDGENLTAVSVGLRASGSAVIEGLTGTHTSELPIPFPVSFDNVTFDGDNKFTTATDVKATDTITIGSNGITINSGASFDISHKGTGKIEITNSGDVDGKITNSGALTLGKNVTVQSVDITNSGTLTLSSNATVKSLDITNSGTLNLGSLTLTNVDITNSGKISSDVTGALAVSATAGSKLTLNEKPSKLTLTLSGAAGTSADLVVANSDTTPVDLTFAKEGAILNLDYGTGVTAAFPSFTCTGTVKGIVNLISTQTLGGSSSTIKVPTSVDLMVSNASAINTGTSIEVPANSGLIFKATPANKLGTLTFASDDSYLELASGVTLSADKISADKGLIISADITTPTTSTTKTLIEADLTKLTGTITYKPAAKTDTKGKFAWIVSTDAIAYKYTLTSSDSSGTTSGDTTVSKDAVAEVIDDIDTEDIVKKNSGTIASADTTISTDIAVKIPAIDGLIAGEEVGEVTVLKLEAATTINNVEDLKKAYIPISADSEWTFKLSGETKTKSIDIVKAVNSGNRDLKACIVRGTEISFDTNVISNNTISCDIAKHFKGLNDEFMFFFMSSKINKTKTSSVSAAADEDYDGTIRTNPIYVMLGAGGLIPMSDASFDIKAANLIAFTTQWGNGGKEIKDDTVTAKGVTFKKNGSTVEPAKTAYDFTADKAGTTTLVVYKDKLDDGKTYIATVTASMKSGSNTITGTKTYDSFKGAAAEENTKSGGGGCTAGFGLFALALLAVPMLRKQR